MRRTAFIHRESEKGCSRKPAQPRSYAGAIGPATSSGHAQDGERASLLSRKLGSKKGRSLLSSKLPTLVVCDPPGDTPPLVPYRRFANASPGPAELSTPSPRRARIWTRVAVRRPDTTRLPGCGHDSQQSPRIGLPHNRIARYRRLSTLYEWSHDPAEGSWPKRCNSSTHLGSRQCACA